MPASSFYLHKIDINVSKSHYQYHNEITLPTINCSPSQPQHAFTLVELLVAVAITGIIATVAVPSYREYVERVDAAQAIADIHSIDTAIAKFEMTNVPPGRLPNSLTDIGMDSLLDPWGNPYQYFTLSNPADRGAARKDKNLVPINSDYDLYSMGKDGSSLAVLTAPVSQDDIIRASNGRFVGKATDF